MTFTFVTTAACLLGLLDGIRSGVMGTVTEFAHHLVLVFSLAIFMVIMIFPLCSRRIPRSIGA